MKTYIGKPLTNFCDIMMKFSWIYFFKTSRNGIILFLASLSNCSFLTNVFFYLVRMFFFSVKCFLSCLKINLCHRLKEMRICSMIVYFQHRSLPGSWVTRACQSSQLVECHTPVEAPDNTISTCRGRGLMGIYSMIIYFQHR